MISPADQEVLEQLVGTATFERGTGYAHGGAVRNRTWSPGGHPGGRARSRGERRGRTWPRSS